MARIAGKDSLNRSAELIAESQENGSVWFSMTKLTGVYVDRHGLDLLIQALGEIRNGMPGTRDA